MTSADDVERCFERRAEESPDAIAIIHEGDALSYRDLRERADEIACRLRACGVTEGSFVAICLPRSFDLIAALIAILQAGGVYVPIDPAFPPSRATAMVRACRPVVLVTLRSHQAHFDGTKVRSLFLDEAAPPPSEGPPTRRTDGTSPAYVLFTSGSTGTPKGVIVSRGALANFTMGTAAAFGVTRADRILQFASIGWDTSAEEIWPCLTHGATLVLRSDAMLDPWELVAGCRRHALTLLDLPTAYLPGFIEAIRATSVPTSLRAVVIGGERVAADRVFAWRRTAPGVHLLNSYGVTEATAITTWCDITEDALPEGVVPIGRPIQGVTVYVLDRDGAPVDKGCAGELVIGGAGVAISYLEQPDLTAERFVPDPFSTRLGARMYRTGDMARERSDGMIEYLGRGDDQVKIRGVRVEVGDVEATLRRYPGVCDAVVLAEERNGERQLVGYVAAGDALPPTSASIRRRLSELVPDFLIPTSIVVLDRLPLLVNGKVDRQALSRTRAELDRAPADEQGTIGKLRAIWADLLGDTAIEPTDRFFERGGNSLNVVTLRMHLLCQLGADVSAADLYRNGSLEGMAALVEQRMSQDGKAQEPAAASIVLPLSPSQIVLFGETTIASMDANNLELLVSVARPARDVLDGIAMLLARHDVFRICGFLKESGTRVQRMAAAPVSEPRVIATSSDAEAALRQAVLAARAQISVENGRLYEWLVHDDGDLSHVYFIGNHLLFDAVSIDVLRDELDFLIAGRACRLPSTASFRAWTEMTGGPHAMERYRRSIPMWQKNASWAPIVERVKEPMPGRSGLDVVERVIAQAAAGVPRNALRQRHRILLGACAHVFAGLFATSEVPCRVVHSGRNQLPGFNDSMTLGWLAHHFPLRITSGADVEQTIRHAEAALAEVGDDSAGYGWLRYAGDEPALAECLELGQFPLYFNYLPEARPRWRAIVDRADLLPPMPEARSSAVGLVIIVEERRAEGDLPLTKIIACFDRSNMRVEVVSLFLDAYAEVLQRLDVQ